MTVTEGTKSGLAGKVVKVQQASDECAKDRASPKSQQEGKHRETSPCKANFQIYRDATALVPKNNQGDETKMHSDTCVENKCDTAKEPTQNGNQEPRQCPFLSNGNNTAPKTKQSKRRKKPAGGKPNGKLQQAPPTETRPPLIATPPTTPAPGDGLLQPPPGAGLADAPGAGSTRGKVAPLWRRARLLAATGGSSLPRRSDIEGAAEQVAEPWWAPPPVEHCRRAQLFGALRNAQRGRSTASDRAAEEAVRAVLYRQHPELRVQRFCQPPGSLYGAISAEEFMLHGSRPVHVHEDLFLCPATLPREQMIAQIRTGQYHRGHIVACFYAYVFAYEFVFFCEYLRQVKCHTPEVRAVLRGVLRRAESMLLISHSATIFSLAPEAMYPQRSPLLYLARLFPMNDPWEADLLCDMANSRDLVADAAMGWNRKEHVLFTMHQDMRRQARLQGRPAPPFHPAVTQPPSSAAAFSNIEGEQVQRLDSHGLVVFQESGATYADVGGYCQFPPLGELSTEQVLRRSVGRHALVRLFDDVFFVGAPPVDLHRAEIRYLRPAEVRLHLQVGFFFESPGFEYFLWHTQQSVNRALREACQLHAPQLTGEEVALMRWVRHHWTETSRRDLHRSACELARFGPYLLNEYGKLLWRMLCENGFQRGALQLCSDLGEHARAVLEGVLAEHNCREGDPVDTGEERM